MQDVMTSSTFYGDNGSVIGEVGRIERMLKAANFNVVRSKVETVPWHPASPSMFNDDMPGNCYFEAHIGCVIKPEQKELLTDIALGHNCHISKNFFKKMEDGFVVNMITLRSYEDYCEKFEARVAKLKEALELNHIQFEKVIIEFAIYDTKVSHDFLWTEEVEETAKQDER